MKNFGERKYFTGCNPERNESVTLTDGDYLSCLSGAIMGRLEDSECTPLPDIKINKHCCPHCGAISEYDSDNFISDASNEKDDEILGIAYEEKQVDMLSLPVYYHIVHCIPCDLSFGGETAKRINELYGLKEILITYFADKLKVGDVILDKNVFTLFTTNRKYEKTTLEAVKACARELAEYCINERIKYLAMPRIGCGHGGLNNWDEVREAILDSMLEVFNSDDEAYLTNYRPFITFCYQ